MRTVPFDSTAFRSYYLAVHLILHVCGAFVDGPPVSISIQSPLISQTFGLKHRAIGFPASIACAARSPATDAVQHPLDGVGDRRFTQGSQHVVGKVITNGGIGDHAAGSRPVQDTVGGGQHVDDRLPKCRTGGGRLTARLP